jgi:hypothetical protein
LGQMIVYFLLACIALKVDQKKQKKENLLVWEIKKKDTRRRKDKLY